MTDADQLDPPNRLDDHFVKAQLSPQLGGVLDEPVRLIDLSAHQCHRRPHVGQGVAVRAKSHQVAVGLRQVQPRLELRSLPLLDARLQPPQRRRDAHARLIEIVCERE